MHKELTQIPIYLEADNKDELMQKMLDMNDKSGHWNQYFDIQKDGNKWVAWFYFDVIELEKVRKNA